MHVAESIVVYAAREATKRATARFENWLRQFSGRVGAIDGRDVGPALRDHLVMVNAWSPEFSPTGLIRSAEVARKLLDLHVYAGLTDRKQNAVEVSEIGRFGDNRSFYAGSREIRREERLEVSRLVERTGHFLLLGPPGAGKTSSLQRIAGAALRALENGAERVPIVLRLRDMRGDAGVLEQLQGILGLRLSIVPGLVEEDWRRRAINQILDSLPALVLVDGLDEVSPQRREDVESELRALMEHTTEARFFVTCRSGEYIRKLGQCTELSLLPLSDAQVLEFAHDWLGEVDGARFYRAVRQSHFFEAAILPLALAQLCALYLRIGEVPSQPVEVYETLLGLLLRDWDELRGVKRTSSYAEFGVQKKIRFLRALSFQLTRLEVRGSFLRRELLHAYGAVCQDFALPEDDAQRVTREIESHSGLVLADGADRFSFLHRTYQEYLTASYLVALPDPLRVTVPAMPAELAVACVLASAPDEFLVHVVAKAVSECQDDACTTFLHVFGNRLLVERPTLRPSPDVGWCFIVMLEALIDPNEDYVWSTLVHKARTLPLVRESIRLALRERASVIQHRHAQDLVVCEPRMRRNIPPTAAEAAFKKRYGDGIVWPKVLFEQLAM